MKLLLFVLTATRTRPQGNAKLSTTKQMSSNDSGRLRAAKAQSLRRALKRKRLEDWFLKNILQSEDEQVVFSPGWYNGTVERANTANRFLHVMTRSLQGQNINTVIMGGSISAGGGLSNDKKDFRGLYHRVLAQWWQDNVFPITGSKIILHNLAVGGTSSNFFTFCYRTLLDPTTSIDIALLDFTVNDYVQFQNSKIPVALPLEQLTREILRIEQESAPSLIFVNFVQGSERTPICNNLENNGQTALANKYGITSVSLKNFLCSNTAFKKSPHSREMFASDGTHASIYAHWKIALMLINYFRKTMLKVIDRINERPRNDIREQILLTSQKGGLVSSTCLDRIHGFNLPEAMFPRNRAVKFYDKPLCFTEITPNGTANGILHQTLKVQEVENVGFQLMPKQFINQTPQKSRSDAFGGWRAKSSNSWLKLSFFIPVMTEKCLPKLNGTSFRNVAIAVRTGGKGATASVWLDNFESHAVSINTHSPFGHTKLITIAKNVTSGHHVVCVSKETPGMFILSGVMAGPSYGKEM